LRDTNLKGGGSVKRLRLAGDLIVLYLQKAIKVLQIMLIHFEEIVAHTEQEVSELSYQLKDVLETKELIQDMIEQLKEEVFKKGE
jgi:hypothetical protein